MNKLSIILLTFFALFILLPKTIGAASYCEPHPTYRQCVLCFEENADGTYRDPSTGDQASYEQCLLNAETTELLNQPPAVSPQAPAPTVPAGTGPQTGDPGTTATGPAAGDPGTTGTGDRSGDPGTTGTGDRSGDPGTTGTGDRSGDPGTLSIGIFNPLKAKNIQKLSADIIDLLIQLGIPVIIFMIIYAGFLYVTARGNPEQISKAHSALMWTLVGAAVLLGAMIIVEVVKSTIDAIKA